MKVPDSLLNASITKQTITSLTQNQLTRLKEQSNYMKLFVHKISVKGIDHLNVQHAMESFYNLKFFPLNLQKKEDVTTFFTNSINLILKIIQFDFTLLHNNKSYCVETVICCQKAIETWNANHSFEDFLLGYLRKRIKRSIHPQNKTKTVELDLSNFKLDLNFDGACVSMTMNDLSPLLPDLIGKYGKECTGINLSSNNLSSIPPWCRLVWPVHSFNVSHNKFTNFESLHDGLLDSVKELWLEGNPLCDNETPITYVKKAKDIFPKLRELDGVQLIGDGVSNAIASRNYLVSDNAHQIVDQFIMHYFTTFDSPYRSNIGNFYSSGAKLTVIVAEGKGRLGIPMSQAFPPGLAKCIYSPGPAMATGLPAIVNKLTSLGEIVHDPASFTVDVPFFKKSTFHMIIDGLLRAIGTDTEPCILTFRKSLVFVYVGKQYLIENEILHIANAMRVVAVSAFQKPMRKFTDMCLINPTEQEIKLMTLMFSKLTKLKQEEAKKRLQVHSWDIKKALVIFVDEVKFHRIPQGAFIDSSDECSDQSEDESDRPGKKYWADIEMVD